MNVASLELCRKLYELSGWEDTDFCYYSNGGIVNGEFAHYREMVFNKEGNIPAYDLGYLTRKMPAKYYNMIKVVDSPEYISYIYKNGAIQWECGGGQPEDCIAELAIELIEQKVIKA